MTNKSWRDVDIEDEDINCGELYDQIKAGTLDKSMINVYNGEPCIFTWLVSCSYHKEAKEYVALYGKEIIYEIPKYCTQQLLCSFGLYNTDISFDENVDITLDMVYFVYDLDVEGGLFREDNKEILNRYYKLRLYRWNEGLNSRFENIIYGKLLLLCDIKSKQTQTFFNLMFDRLNNKF